MVKLRTMGLRAGGHVGEDHVAAGILKCVLLQAGGLVVGGDPRVSVNHARHVSDHATTRQWHGVSER